MSGHMKPLLRSSRWELNWAKVYAAYTEAHCVRSTPWSTVYQLSASPHDYWLKILPPQDQAKLHVSVAISEAFPGYLPKVIASDPAHGCLLMADHAGETLRYSRQRTHYDTVLCRYGEMQAASIQQKALLSTLPRTRAKDTYQALLQFLSDPEGAARYIGERKAAYYHQSVKPLTSLFRSFLKRSDRLPVTLNHNDLRPSNSAYQASSKTLIIFDWDEASSGPCGLSLHALFSGCSAIYDTLHQSKTADECRQNDPVLGRYIERLIECDAADWQQLRVGLPASSCLGMMHYINSFQDYQSTEADERRQIAKNIRKRLDNLLDIAERLVLDAQQDPRPLLKHYFKYQQSRRANRFAHRLSKQLISNPIKQQQLLDLLLKHGQSQATLQLLQTLPDEQTADWDEVWAKTYLLAYEPKKAKPYLKRLLAQSPNDKPLLAMKKQIQQWKQEKTAPIGHEKSVTATVLPLWIEQQQVPVRWARHTAHRFQEQGTLILRNAFPIALINQLHQAFTKTYHPYLQSSHHSDTLRVGDNRFMMTVSLDEPFNHPLLCANPAVRAVMSEILSDEHILGSFTCVTSLSGAKTQRMHKDHPALFESHAGSNHPSFAVTVLVPLVDTGGDVGTTEVQPGSHRLSAQDAEALPTVAASLKRGDCLFMDYRLSHRGLANSSPKHRPVLSLVHHRPWFRDHVNFNKQPPLVIPHTNKIDASYKARVAWQLTGNH